MYGTFYFLLFSDPFYSQISFFIYPPHFFFKNKFVEQVINKCQPKTPGYAGSLRRMPLERGAMWSFEGEGPPDQEDLDSVSSDDDITETAAERVESPAPPVLAKEMDVVQPIPAMSNPRNSPFHIVDRNSSPLHMPTSTITSDIPATVGSASSASNMAATLSCYVEPGISL